MSRRIVTSQFQAAGGGAEVDTYFDRLLKYIPADIVAAWTVVSALIAGANGIPRETVLWIAFVVGLILAAAYTYRQTLLPNVPPAITQTALATFAFAVWVFALGGPFSNLAWYNPIYGSLLLIAYTLIVPLIIPRE